MFRRPLCQLVSCYHEIIVIIVISAEHRGEGEGDTVETHERGSSLSREAGNSALSAHQNTELQELQKLLAQT